MIDTSTPATATLQGSQAHDLPVELHRWGRLFAAFAIIFGGIYSVLSSVPDVTGALSGVKADLLWPAIVLGLGAAASGVTGFVLQAFRR